MTTKDDFTPDEWERLLTAPWVAGLLIVFADTHITGMAGEFRALWQALTVDAPSDAPGDLLAELVADMEERDGDEDTPAGDEDLDKEELLALLASAADLIDARCRPDEATGYREWIRNAATATAEASKESWFFGIGGERVSSKEKDAMAEIDAALGRWEPIGSAIVNPDDRRGISPCHASSSSATRAARRRSSAS